MLEITKIDTFGDVSAETDAVLEYFLETKAVEQINDGKYFLVLGRKGTGKTAIVRYLTESPQDDIAKALSLKNYPWKVHETRIDSGASENDAYTSSWRYLIATELAAAILSSPKAKAHSSTAKLRQFFQDNYGGPAPLLSEILRPASLRMTEFSIQPKVMGNQLGSVSLARENKDHSFGLELNAVSSAIVAECLSAVIECDIGTVSLHFDELDQGIAKIDDQLKRLLIGLIQATKEFVSEMRKINAKINAVVYLRDDLWDELAFSDKNKITQTSCLNLVWNSTSLLALVNARIKAKLGATASWDTVFDQALMRGSQTKWNHLLSRTFLRPRDVIRFMNAALEEAKKRQNAAQISNQDITGCRDTYSRYLKAELDDEIKAHWPYWDDALSACSAIETITFDKRLFVEQYDLRKSKTNLVTADESLELLHKFSVIGYDRRSGYGGQSWVFQYTNPESGWDTSATKFKVHLGLKEYAKLREERQSV